MWLVVAHFTVEAVAKCLFTYWCRLSHREIGTPNFWGVDIPQTSSMFSIAGQCTSYVKCFAKIHLEVLTKSVGTKKQHLQNWTPYAILAAAENHKPAHHHHCRLVEDRRAAPWPLATSADHSIDRGIPASSRTWSAQVRRGLPGRRLQLGSGLLPSFVSTASRSAAFAGTAGSSRAMWVVLERRISLTLTYLVQ